MTAPPETTSKLIPILELAVKRTGGSVTDLATALGVKRPALYQWKRVPAERVPDLERIASIPRHKIRPDLYEKPGK